MATAAAPVARDASETATQLCNLESEVHSWQLKCFQAEAQLRLVKQRSRGETHEQWPRDAAAFERLYDAVAQLQSQASAVEASAVRPLRDLLAARGVCARLEKELRFEKDELCHLGRTKDEEEQIVRDLANSESSLAAQHQQRLAELERRRDDVDSRCAVVKQLRSELRNHRPELERISGLKEQYLQEAAAAREVAKRLELAIEDERPRLEALAEDCGNVVAEANRARAAAHRRSETVAALEEEISERIQQGEDETTAEEAELAACQERLRELVDASSELEEQSRKARNSHQQSLRAVRQGGAALRSALGDSEFEHQGIADAVRQAQSTVEGLKSGHDLRRARERALAAVAEELGSEEQAAAVQFQELDGERSKAEERWQSAEVEFEALTKEGGRLAQAEKTVADEATATETTVGELKEEVRRMYDEFGAAACARRSEKIASCRSEISAFAEESKKLSKECDYVRGPVTYRQQQLRERQLVSRRAAMEAASKLKASYTELIGSIRGAASKGRTPADVALSTQKSVRRIGKQVDDLLRFLESAGEEPPKFDDPSLDVTADMDSFDACWAAPDLQLPDAVMEAFLAAHEQNPSGSRNIEQLTKERQQLAQLKSSMAEANASHATQVAKLAGQTNTLQEELQLCEQELQSEKAVASETRTTLEQQLQQEGMRQTESQMKAVMDIPQKIHLHSNELARLRREHAELQARRLEKSWQMSSGKAELPADPSMPLSRKVKLKEAEVTQLRERVAAQRRRYEELQAEVDKDAARADAIASSPSATSPKGKESPRAEGKNTDPVRSQSPPRAKAGSQTPSGSLPQPQNFIRRGTGLGGGNAGSVKMPTASAPATLIGMDVSAINNKLAQAAAMKLNESGSQDRLTKDRAAKEAAAASAADAQQPLQRRWQSERTGSFNEQFGASPNSPGSPQSRNLSPKNAIASPRSMSRDPETAAAPRSPRGSDAARVAGGKSPGRAGHHRQGSLPMAPASPSTPAHSQDFGSALRGAASLLADSSAIEGTPHEVDASMILPTPNIAMARSGSELGGDRLRPVEATTPSPRRGHRLISNQGISWAQLENMTVEKAQAVQPPASWRQEAYDRREMSATDQPSPQHSVAGGLDWSAVGSSVNVATGLVGSPGGTAPLAGASHEGRRPQASAEDMQQPYSTTGRHQRQQPPQGVPRYVKDVPDMSVWQMGGPTAPLLPIVGMAAAEPIAEGPGCGSFVGRAVTTQSPVSSKHQLHSPTQFAVAALSRSVSPVGAPPPPTTAMASASPMLSPGARRYRTTHPVATAPSIYTTSSSQARLLAPTAGSHVRSPRSTSPPVLQTAAPTGAVAMLAPAPFAGRFPAASSSRSTSPAGRPVATSRMVWPAAGLHAAPPAVAGARALGQHMNGKSVSRSISPPMLQIASGSPSVSFPQHGAITASTAFGGKGPMVPWSAIAEEALSPQRKRPQAAPPQIAALPAPPLPQAPAPPLPQERARPRSPPPAAAAQSPPTFAALPSVPQEPVQAR
eukprot:TRINITY_DN111204_c0_g1_i1.p1 TRINITY_DN111204_c0_g1~~TRINITY_DN111204_c0_g1_i1.p1  ORF type:complete len:1503 (+),score=426.34 TRINITY_DN111204_c0_g1_i1:90-4598(+)